MSSETSENVREKIIEQNIREESKQESFYQQQRVLLELLYFR